MNKASFNDRRGLTLLELVIVLTILVALAGLAIPLLTGLAAQTNGSTNAAVVGDVDRAVGTYFTRHDAHADGWDSLLNPTDALFTRLHPALTSSSGAMLAVSSQPLSSVQAQSLKEAGIDYFYDADETPGRAPNASGNAARSIDPQSGKKFVRLNLGDPAAAALANEAFGVGANNADLDPSKLDFLVVGLGGNAAIKGETLMEAPVVLSADPATYYARVLCVFAIPSATATETFRARYLGCFLPDGTTLRQNLDKYQTARSN